MGESAIDKLIEALERLRMMKLPSDPEVGPCTLNIGMIEGGRAPNVIPDSAKALLLYRLIGPSEQLRSEMQQQKSDGQSVVAVQAGEQLTGYSHQSAALATKRFKASLNASDSVFMLTHAQDGNGNILLEVDKDSGQPRARVDLGKEREPVYAVDDVAGMLFLRTAPGTLVGYRL